MIALYDNIKMVLEEIQTPDVFWSGLGKVIEWKGLKWTPELNKATKELSHYKVHIHNLFIRLYRNEVSCTNSVHKFSIGINYENYTINQFCNGIIKLNNITKWNWFNARIIKLEAGINCKTNAQKFYTKFCNYKGKDYLEMRTSKGLKTFGTVCHFTEYSFVIYDKRFQVLHQENKRISYDVLRIELKINDLSCIRNLQTPIKIYLVRDLLNKTICMQLFKFIKRIIMKSIKKSNINLSKFSNTELKIIASFENKEIFKLIELKSKRNADELRRKYQTLMKM